MKKTWSVIFLSIVTAVFLSACEKPIVFQPNGPVSEMLSDTIILSILVMLGIVVIVFILLIYMLVKFRASKQPKDYVPPHMEGSHTLEVIWTAIPIIIVACLAVVTVKTVYSHEETPEGYEDKEPLVIYASTSNWKWHFSYPEEDIETINYVNIPTDRPVEFRLYAFGPITSFWVPQLGGQKYAMSDMVTSVTYVADDAMSMEGKNTSFSGRGFDQMQFEVLSMQPADFEEWVDDVQANEEELTEERWDEILEAEFLGRETYTGTHLEYDPAPEGENAGHNHGNDSTTINDEEVDSHDHSNH
ncbi:MAG: cytochrome aa3 quinol oxidase subunit II [Bacillus sp. (in: firmicutes)]